MKFRESFSFVELKLVSFYRDLISEAIISLYLVMYTTFTMVTLNSNIYSLNMTHVGLLVGFTVYLLIEGYGPISGGFMNPSAAFTHFLAGRITFVRAFCYTGVQCCGGILGSKIVFWLTPQDLRKHLQAFVPADSIEPWQGFIIEFLLTFNLLYVGLSTTNKKTHTVSLPSLPTAFSIGCGIFAAGTWTGACQNPIVALGPSVMSGNFSHHWIYWAGAYAAAVMAAIIDKLFTMVHVHQRRDKVAQSDPPTHEEKKKEAGRVYTVDEDTNM